MKIYTRTGDNGETGLFGGKRLSKHATRLHAYGTIDELNAALGIVLSSADVPTTVRKHLEHVQHMLFQVGADLATPLESRATITRIDSKPALEVEAWIDELDEALPQLKKFIFPSGSRLGSELHLARTVCRRAERWICRLSDEEKINQAILPYINRLGDYLFVAARWVNKHMKVLEREVEIPRSKSMSTS